MDEGHTLIQHKLNCHCIFQGRTSGTVFTDTEPGSGGRYHKHSAVQACLLGAGHNAGLRA